MINNIANHHYRTPQFFPKIEKLLIGIQESIKKHILSNNIYFSFKNNKRILLFLIQNKIIEIDRQFVDRMLFDRLKKKNYETGMVEYLFPEIHPFLRKKDYKSITGKIYYLEKKDVQDSANIPLFTKARSKGENTSTICQLIREDSIEKFDEYVTKNCIDLNGRIQRSIFETNPLLNKKRLPTLIEYAAFYGSVKIFNFLRMKGAKIEPFLMKFAVHSNKADMILLAEQFVDKEDLSVEDFYQLSFDETLKCHNFRLSEYFINKFVNYPKMDKSVKWLNYEYFPTTIGESVFYYICKNDICELFSKELASNHQIVIYCYLAAKMMNNVGIMQAIKDINICSNYTLEKSVQVYQDSFVVKSTFYVENYDLPPIPYVTKVVIPPNAEGFYTNIFTNCPHMEEIVFKKPSSLKCLNNGVFYGVIYLKEIKIPASVKSIGNFAFGRCNALKKIKFQRNSSLESIGKGCFFDCSALNKIVIPSSVKKVGKKIFEKCTSLTRAKFPATLDNKVTREYLCCPEETKILFCSD